MNNAKEIVEASGKAIIKNLARCLPLGSTALDIYDELQSKQVGRKIQRLEEFYSALDAKILEVENRINHDFISKPDFQDVFEEATRYVVQERLEKKRAYFKNILVNSIISTECDYDKTERYFRLLDNLGNIELEVMAVLDNPKDYCARHDIQLDSIMNGGHMSAEGVLTGILRLNIFEVDDAATILFSNGLLKDNLINIKREFANNPINVLTNILTIRGKKFMGFLKG